jgi:hypothetical protein
MNIWHQFLLRMRRLSGCDVASNMVGLAVAQFIFLISPSTGPCGTVFVSWGRFLYWMMTGCACRRLYMQGRLSYCMAATPASRACELRLDVCYIGQGGLVMLRNTWPVVCRAQHKPPRHLGHHFSGRCRRNIPVTRWPLITFPMVKSVTSFCLMYFRDFRSYTVVRHRMPRL